MLTVVLVSETRVYREGLAEWLDQDGRVQVTATAGNLDSAILHIRCAQPRIILFDYALSEGLRVIPLLQALGGEGRLVALGVPDTTADILACAEAGVAGYALRSASCDDLVKTLLAVDRGEFRCSPRVAASLARRVAALVAERRGDGAEAPFPLTPREQEIAELLERGWGNKEIARSLGIEVATAKNHVHNILAKLNVHRRGEAAATVRRRLRPKLPVWRHGAGRGGDGV